MEVRIMKKAVMFGGGNIGRGFIGAVLAEAGYHVVFADVNQDLLCKLNELGKYTVHIRDIECREQLVENVSGVNSTTDEVVKEIASADLVTTAVGLTVLPRIAGAVANGIKARMEAGSKEYLNIIACENAIRASSQLKNAVYEKLDVVTKAYADMYVGFPDSAVDRIVPPVANDPENPLDVTVESFYEWSVERSGFRGEIPDIPAMHVVDNLMAYLERKLFTLNTGHCITAYLGFLKGYETIEQAIADEKIYAIVRGAMTESGEGLIKKHGFEPDVHWAYMESILKRYQNPYLKDALVRIGREPNRKLAPTDRLIAPLLNSKSFGISVDNLIKGIAAALHFDYADDPQSQELQKKIRECGVESVLKEISGIEDKTIIEEIVNAYQTICDEVK